MTKPTTEERAEHRRIKNWGEARNKRERKKKKGYTLTVAQKKRIEHDR